ncbi:cytochrome P450 [Aspergillus vadensis CBS 113365]|uniref:Cytochrome P450 alkane hydroxylase n=1 Tax=Aspergillus vadensis (strain CBS 113365 / IMI 142717 / IBT 24658) TaxID=1448311 RepID=A0A319B1L4_ASPVC|nr:cytochrome P450 alkane hydroxylase [Aspergillus vadensis CBS 113365]PYH66566.1 cytochrome P450 alkane hydroxylase [Aspergillus vadensis CBS 113365]
MDFNQVDHPVFTIATVILFLWYTLTYLQRKWTHRRIIKANNCQPPPYFPQKDPIFGLDIIFEQIKYSRKYKTLERFSERFKLYGNTYTQRRLTPYVITCEPENIKTILSLRFKDYGLAGRIDALGPLLGHGIFTTDGEHWVQSRAMVRPNFAKEQVAHLEIFEELVNELVSLIPTDGKTVDLQELFFELTIDSATEFLFGHSVHSLKKRRAGACDSTEQDFASAFNYAQKAIAMNIRLGKLKFLRRDRKAEEANRICHKLVEQFVDSALRVREQSSNQREFTVENSHDAKGKKNYLFLHSLAQQTGDRRRIRDELMNILLAGRDTTASLLSNLFFMLAKNPRIWNKLREEVAFLEGRPPSYEQLRNLTYVKYCLNESLRLHPVVPANLRFANTDTVLPCGGGPDGKSPVFVPKGSIVAYHVYALHRREEFFGPDANEFRPERWAEIRPGWEYLPFNGGPRICVGQQYALTEAGYVTVRLAQKFSVLESRDSGPWVESYALTVCSRNGTKVALR